MKKDIAKYQYNNIIFVSNLPYYITTPIIKKFINNDGCEETFFSDGTIQKVDKNNTLILQLKDGTKEVKYPDGREERILPNGNVETIQKNNSFSQDNDDVISNDNNQSEIQKL